MANIVAFAGSLRAKSFNKSILRYAVAAAEKQGITVHLVDLGEANLPLINQDLESQSEAGIVFPAEVEAFRALVRNADGLLISTPEYNFSIPAPLKNAVDWLSRPGSTLANKVVAIIGASAGPSGAVSAQEHLRTVLAINGSFTLPGAVRIPNAYQTINEASGEILVEDYKTRIESLVKTLNDEILLRKRA
eukprot:CAMPEP_0184675498 /NCGR_PEP_ID=MMETSP0308-20130426/87819_1 /TAXON_ID=38269 /ORGANISM="Gloeochaete witrockiana, Strain SAG 46.84" /LENGTH=190 /DNA_ID=CAMNT_0027123205 /DNA_START=265 /DNA_END=837 /DNA_ORIENTATION=+